MLRHSTQVDVEPQHTQQKGVQPVLALNVRIRDEDADAREATYGGSQPGNLREPLISFFEFDDQNAV